MPTLNRAMSNRNGNFHSLDREQRRSPKHSPWKREGIMSEDEMTVEDSDRDSIETATETDADCIEGLQELSNGVGERMSSLLERVNEKSFHVSLKIEVSLTESRLIFATSLIKEKVTIVRHCCFFRIHSRR
mmetsp:Transcript_9830/g.29258  ORF Transcript_9830/g.29258 Transcript_9830/m.29258 type:complete len:131 (-) Transcript_9830:12-404(-)